MNGFRMYAAIGMILLDCKKLEMNYEGGINSF